MIYISYSNYKHRVKECNSIEIKCANCGSNHTSNYGGCSEYKKKLNETIEKIKNKSNTVDMVRSFNDVVKQNTSNEVNVTNLNKTILELTTQINSLEKS